MIFSCFIFPFVASQADLSPLWDDNFSQTFNNVETNPDFYSLDAETNPDFSSLDAETNPGFYSLDAETSPDYYTLDAENNPDFYTSDVEPIWSSPDQVSQGTFGLFSDPDTDLLAGVGEGCPPNGQPINKSRKRNDACPAPGSSDDSQLRIPNPLDAKKKGELAPTSDDSDICRVFEALQARFFAVCDSGRPNDRILNRATGEYSLIDCERGK